MNYTRFKSGAELLRVRDRDQTLLPSGEKVDEGVESWMEDSLVESRLVEHHALLEEPKLARKDQLASGEWLPESRMVKLLRPGKFWHHMGVETDIGKCLYPEEAVYLIDIGELEVVYKGLPLSLQQAQSVLVQDAYHLDQYLVYAHLTRTGCKVVRHQPHLIYTKYEKEIRIDQHQVSRKGTKLKLGIDKATPTENSTQNSTQPESLDTAIEELYACLGNTAANPLTSAKSGAPRLASDDGRTNAVKGKEEKSEIKALQPSPQTLAQHEIKRREMIELFPTMVGGDVTTIDVESADLLPNNAIPRKKSYRISIEALEYYSVYDTRHQYHYENPPRRPWDKKWNDSRNARWDSSTRDSNWRSRDYSYQSYDYRERGNRWRQFGAQRDSRNAWREDGNGSWGSTDGNWRHHNPESDMRFSDERFREEYRGSGPYMGFRGRHGFEQDMGGGGECDEFGHRYSGPETGFGEGHGESTQFPQEDQIDFSVWPEWKRKRRRKYRQQGRDRFPSCIVKLKTKVSSWKEYKKAVAEKDAKKQLTEGCTRILWEGRTTPLLAPSATSSASSSSSSSSSSTLLSCSLNAQVTNLNAFKNSIPQEDKLKVIYDAYLPSVAYKKSNPPSPSKRIVVMRGGSVPSPGQILQVTSQFVDGVTVAFAVVTAGEVRLYTFTPGSLPPPQSTP